MVAGSWMTCRRGRGVHPMGKSSTVTVSTGLSGSRPTRAVEGWARSRSCLAAFRGRIRYIPPRAPDLDCFLSKVDLEKVVVARFGRHAFRAVLAAENQRIRRDGPQLPRIDRRTRRVSVICRDVTRWEITSRASARLS